MKNKETVLRRNGLTTRRGIELESITFYPRKDLGDAGVLPSPQSMIVDFDGNFLVCCEGDHTIKRITQDAKCEIFAGKKNVVGQDNGHRIHNALLSRPIDITLGINGKSELVSCEYSDFS